MSRKDELEAELEVAVLEDELIELKGRDNVDEVELRDVKNRLREARCSYREISTAGTANPDVINSKAEVNE